MALARLPQSLRRLLCTPAFRAHSRHVCFTRPLLDENTDGDGQEQQQQQQEQGQDEEAAPGGSEESPSRTKEAPVIKRRPYSEVLRDEMTAKYLSYQPIARPHLFCKRDPADVPLDKMRLQYKHRVSSVRKQYAMELQKKAAAKATHDKKQREEILAAKEERIRLKKERSAQRALEVAEENRLLQEQLAKERAERRAYRKEMDIAVQERRQWERDVIRQQSGMWIEEKDLEERIVEALLNPIDL